MKLSHSLSLNCYVVTHSKQDVIEIMISTVSYVSSQQRYDRSPSKVVGVSLIVPCLLLTVNYLVRLFKIVRGEWVQIDLH